MGANEMKIVQIKMVQILPVIENRPTPNTPNTKQHQSIGTSIPERAV
jgi:hypothetical protein